MVVGNFLIVVFKHELLLLFDVDIYNVEHASKWKVFLFVFKE